MLHLFGVAAPGHIDLETFAKEDNCVLDLLVKHLDRVEKILALNFVCFLNVHLVKVLLVYFPGQYLVQKIFI